MSSCKKLSQVIMVMYLTIGIVACIGESNDTSSKTTGASISSAFVNYSPEARVHPEQFKKFRNEDKDRAHKFCDTYPNNNELTGMMTVDNLKNGISQIPSHILEGFKHVGGEIEFNSGKFQNKELVARIDPEKPNKVVYNTHIDNRDFSQEKLDTAIFTLIQQKYILEYKKYADHASSSKNETKEKILVASYRDFIEKVFSDDKNPLSENQAKDFFLGKNSPLHKFANVNNITDADIKQNKELVQQGISKAITYHGAMGSSRGDVFLASRFPDVNKLITELYFEPHGKDSPHLTDKTIPKIIARNMNSIQEQFVISSSAFDPEYHKYISSERLGSYLAINPDIADRYTSDALQKLQDTSKPILTRIQDSYKSGVGDCNVQSIVLAGVLRSEGVSADIYSLSTPKGLSHSVVLAKMPGGEKFIVDSWAGLIVPADKYSQFYADFTDKTIDPVLNKLISEIEVTPSASQSSAKNYSI